ncbi:MAG: hypothetical protein PUA56_05220 [Bacillales bacterium]|nr:hypothetical protein [Bacillales bacterium]
MKNSKRILLSMAALLSLGIVVGCGGTPDVTEKPEDTSTAKATSSKPSTAKPTSAPTTSATPVHKHAFSYGDPVVKAGESTYAVGVCECGKKAYKISAAQDLNGKITAEGKKLPKGTSGSYDGTAIALYKFTLEASIKGHLQAKVNVDVAENCSESNGYSYYTGKNGGQSPIAVLPDNKTNTVMTVNGDTIKMPTTTYYAMGITGTTADTCGIADYGEFTLKAGTNEFTLAAVDSYGLNYYEFYFVES